ncbi:tyrosine-protein phosphatase [Pseudonocardia pini]|uniref:tyrosine-protein phosphatase n=1 Tax=Pseudonocardia pini TaxID=2758030 RepID=UPI0015F0C669|nr:tyrosine-protein phosphatase [Pseudonocardia pini]
MTTTDRWLEFEGLSNVRDVGGLPLQGGGVTRSGVLLRSESLDHVTPADVSRLQDELGLRLVLDLRTDREIAQYGESPLIAAGVETVQFTFIPEAGRELPEIGEDFHPMVGNYLGYLRDKGANVVGAIRRIARAEGPTLVHCAAGKDRTGTLVALVLESVGVEREAVVEDYALSATRIEAMFRRWTAANGEEMPSAEEILRHSPRAEAMDQVLRVIDERDGGAAAWLQANGLTDDELAALRERLG